MRRFPRVMLVIVSASLLVSGCADNTEKKSSSFSGETRALIGDTAAGVESAQPLGAPDFDPTEKLYLQDSLTAAALDQTLLDAFEESLQYDLLFPYYPTAYDGSYGGFVEDRSSTWALQQNGDKYVAAQARYTWTAAKAAQFYSGDPNQSADYLAAAAVGFDFLKRMWGYNYGGTIGFGLMSDRDGSNLREGDKGEFVAYGNAFAVYASAAYFSASGNTEALTYAINGYNFLEDYLHDSTYGGYYITPNNTNKDTNTNLHVIEALIELYQALPTSHALRPEVGSRVAELLGHFHDDAIHCETATDCFAYPIMNRDWSASSNSVSFGHDVELAMLMVEAIAVLDQDPASSLYMTKIKNVVDFTFTNAGVRSDGGMYYTGTYSNGNVSVNDYQLQWWPQAEGLGALCMMQLLAPNEPFYSDQISLVWSYIQNEIIDQNQNGWVRNAGNFGEAKAWEWHCNYHNSRALMNCLNWLRASDCIDTNPSDGVCDHCVNGIMDESETDINCGGNCDPCADGAGCIIGADCSSEYCNQGTCEQPPEPTCSDGIQNQDETGVDCGGQCPACVCETALYEPDAMTFSTGGVVSDGFNIWSNGTGSVSHEFVPGDMVVTVNARGEQAGGGWPNMVVSVGGTVIGNLYVDNDTMQPYAFDYTAPGGGQQITVEFTNDYYQSPDDRNLIIGSIGVSCDGQGPDPSCEDGIQNQGETGIDCGGPCPACPTCDDGIMNQGEEGIDCGGPCPQCPSICGDGTCALDEDCVTCQQDCGACPTCDDNIQNGDETGVDCGGSCPACTVGTAVWLEAEDGVLSGNPTFASGSDANASGGAYIEPTSSDTGSPGPNRATYTFNVAAGNYKVWGRVIAPNGNDDSFWVSVDGGNFVKWNSIPDNSSWAWDDVHDSDNGGSTMIYTLLAGVHTMVIANREDGVKLDKLYITADGDIPTGLGGDINPCIPTNTCESAGADCGTIDDGCGTSLDCGGCNTGFACNDTTNQCECAPETCVSLGAQCGMVSDDGCGGTLDCGSCNSGEVCNGSNQCECVPDTCASLGAQCGTVDDGCGTPLNCGTCGVGESCNSSNQCDASCVPDTCASLGAQCGTVDDGCGTSLNCGTCGVGETCNSSNQCDASCVPDTCASLGAQCGTVDDGCGTSLNCGTCGAGESCNSGNQCELELFCGDGICNNNENCSTCQADCGACETCNDGIQNQNETGIDCGGVCPACEPEGCTCPSGCDAVVDETVEFVKDGTGDTCYFFNTLGSYINSWNTEEININGADVTNVYLGAWSYPAMVDSGYYIYYRSAVPWGHIEVK